jgi:phosphatidylethanolamine N-methyltransferase
MSRSRNNSIGASTPSVTDGDTASETEAIDTEPDDEMEGSSRPITPRQMSRRASPIPSAKARARRQSASQHDLLARFFRKDPIGLRNLDMFRWVGGDGYD